MNKILFYLIFLVILILLTVDSIKSYSLDIFFSEYIEGASNNKALEIFNPTTTNIDLSQYKIVSFINGSSNISAEVALTGILNSHEVLVVCNSNANTSILNLCDIKISGVGTVMTFNGDDTLAITKLNGEIVDVFGQIGFDPGTEWGTDLISTQDNTLRRKCNINQGDVVGTDIFEPLLEWEGFVSDTYTDLGFFTPCFATVSPSISPLETPNYTVSPSPLFTIVPQETYTPEPVASLSPTPTLVATTLPIQTSSPLPTPHTTNSPTPPINYQNIEHEYKLLVNLIYRYKEVTKKYLSIRWPIFRFIHN